jgi:hypothetical protein
MKVAVEHYFTGQTVSLTGGIPDVGVTAGGYDSTRTMLSSLMAQSTGPNPENKYISTKPASLINIADVFLTPVPQSFPHVVKWSDNIYWIFMASINTASSTRPITLTEFDTTSNTLTYKGYITLSGSTVSGNKTVRSLRAMVYTHTSGTVSTSGSSSTISGSSTQFTTDRIAVGARIGFGTTDPKQVTTWYDITAISNDTTLTIGSSVNLSEGTSYVIEEIRIAISVTNATSLNGGVHLIKGLNYNTFNIVGGTTIAEATTVDNIRASYLLRDGVGTLGTATATVTYSTTNILSLNNHGFVVNDPVIFTTTGTLPTGISTGTTYYVISTNLGTNQFSVSTSIGGSALSISGAGTGTHTVHSSTSFASASLALDDEGKSATNHTLYHINTPGGGGNATIIKYNIRAALTSGSVVGGPSNGVTVSAFVLKTGTYSVSGTISQSNSSKVFTPSHGVSSGEKSLFFVTTTRVYRSPVSTLTAGSNSWLSDYMLEIPPGGSTTYTTFSSMSQVVYSSTIDKLFITNTSGRYGIYVGNYDPAGGQFDKIIGSNLTRVKQSTTASGASDGLFPQQALSIWTEDGWMFAVPNSLVTSQNWLYVFPFGADAYYHSSSKQGIITPKLLTDSASKLYHVYVDHMEYAGDYGLGFPVESYRLWYRTTGIDDNSGEWTEVDVGADLGSANPSNYIQFKIAFDIMGEICVPTRIYSITCLYENSIQDSHYQPSLAKSSAVSRIFAWRQVSSWGSNIPNLRIRLYDADTNNEILNDTISLSSYGTWQYSTDGTNWNSWNAAQDTIGNYIRYNATSFALSGVTVRALLTQA